MIQNKIALTLLLLLLLAGLSVGAYAEDGYRLWQRYDLVKDAKKLKEYQGRVQQVVIEGSSPTLTVAKQELQQGLQGLLGKNIGNSNMLKQANSLLVGTPQNSPAIAALNLNQQLGSVGKEGYLILTTTVNRKKATVIAANSDVGALYGVFHFLRLIQTHQPVDQLNISNAPKTQHRILNHWDNLDRTVERGYAGFSLWDWHKLPDYIDDRYLEYARANASIGINGTVLTNVNANALILTKPYLEKVKALADAFRPYGLKVYLTARFSAPIEIGGLKTADPLDAQVQAWWKTKAEEIYTYIPDFGGFLVKANSEGQPGPQNYKRTHADGANMLADAVAPKGGIVMWRAFVYDNEVPEDRIKQAYNEFKHLDGQFRKNVMVQVKNGPLDFQPREPFHPLFGAMPQTPLMMEFQLTQEYLGQATNLVYQAPLYKEVLDADTHAKGAGSTVAKVVDGTLHNYQLTGMAGVTNIGNDRNWTGHMFGQSNWYTFGRLAWDHTLTSEAIADEWLRMTFNNEEKFVSPVKEMMLQSRETLVNYMTPLGLHHIMGWSHHYGPGPWVDKKHRADWTAVYYHRASAEGIGFDRTASGSNAIAQYFPPVAQKFGNLATCPEEFLLWFHRVSWDYKVKSGRNLWDELCHRYYAGAEGVKQMQQTWNAQEANVDPERFRHVKTFLSIQEKEARWWRDACVLYFQSFSKRPIPAGLPKTDNTLEYYRKLEPKFVPGI
ncbi:alpha-glucuronidase family glycosyl hydrolase [Adhaeribacter rhizoryzae]|uniref:Xylan alpha-1,2-glucuronidase n=1 Tax=Adhaeribacter rhizoryzae TaxID=2607907 RepID=A0A5M6D633_9BACT|nr:alpha-glucuronidase family glycosyl hydrolase [Adhaeribacter rhizoryzae]KAA5541269.1 alpha-glucuronidase [Adhaeribacter rhizoryzae]